MNSYEDGLRDLWDNVKWNKIHTIGISEGEEKKDMKKYLKRLQLKTFLTWEGK